MDSPWQSFHRRGTHITADSQATGVSIATWFLASTFLIMYLSGQIVKYVVLRRLRLDDYFILLATILAIGLSLSYSVAASNGLGNKNVSIEQLDTIQKASYAADILYIAAISSVKLSLLFFIRQISMGEKQARFIMSLITLTVIGTVACMFAASFQCQVPHAWETFTLQCFNQSGFWISFGVLDILTDVSIVVASAVLVWNVHIPISRKAVVVGCFVPRILVIAAAACRLSYLVPIFSQQRSAFALLAPVVCTEVQICLSISTACVPGVKPLFEAIEAGVWQVDDLRRRNLSLGDLYSRGYLKDTGSWLELKSNIEGGNTGRDSNTGSRDTTSRHGRTEGAR